MVFGESELPTKVLGKTAMQAQSFYQQHASALLPALQPQLPHAAPWLLTAHSIQPEPSAATFPVQLPALRP